MPSDAPPPIDYATPRRGRKQWNPLLLVAMLVIGMVFLFALLLPPLFKQRQGSSRVPCASNIKQIGQAFLLYSNENRNQYPPDLQTAVATQGLTWDVLVCPQNSSSGNATTRSASDAVARAANNLDYIYVGEGLTNRVSAEEPILFERLADHDHTGGNVLFGDGHVEFITKTEILKLLEPLRGTPRLTQEEYDAILAKSDDPMPPDEPTPTAPPPTIDYAAPKPMQVTDTIVILALCFGVTGLVVPFVGVIGILLGYAGKRSADQHGSRRNRRLSLAAMGCGVLGIVWMIAAFAINESIDTNGRRERANQIRCAMNMRRLEQAFSEYASVNGGVYPPDLVTTLRCSPEIMDASSFNCESGQSTRAEHFVDDPTARSNQHLDYIYVGEGLTNKVSAEEPILFERLSDHDHFGGNVLFGDGHVEFFKKQILKLLEPLRGTPRLTQEEYDAIVAK